MDAPGSGWLSYFVRLKEMSSENSSLGIQLEYGDRVVSFPILSASAWTNAGGLVCIEVEADWGDLDMNSIDSSYGPPMVNAMWDPGDATPIESISGKTVLIPKSYDEDLEDHVTTFYLSEHLELDDASFVFGQAEGDSAEVKFSGRVEEDPTGSDPDKGIKVTGQAVVALRFS